MILRKRVIGYSNSYVIILSIEELVLLNKHVGDVVILSKSKDSITEDNTNVLEDSEVI
jgi:hypothetical protein